MNGTEIREIWKNMIEREAEEWEYEFDALTGLEVETLQLFCWRNYSTWFMPINRFYTCRGPVVCGVNCSWDATSWLLVKSIEWVGHCIVQCSPELSVKMKQQLMVQIWGAVDMYEILHVCSIWIVDGQIPRVSPSKFLLFVLPPKKGSSLSLIKERVLVNRVEVNLPPITSHLTSPSSTNLNAMQVQYWPDQLNTFVWPTKPGSLHCNIALVELVSCVSLSWIAVCQFWLEPRTMSRQVSSSTANCECLACVEVL